MSSCYILSLELTRDDALRRHATLSLEFTRDDALRRHATLSLELSVFEELAVLNTRFKSQNF